jgi:hypothetical protein
MAALYPMRPAGSYTTPWDTIDEAEKILRIDCYWDNVGTSFLKPSSL